MDLEEAGETQQGRVTCMRRIRHQETVPVGRIRRLQISTSVSTFRYDRVYQIIGRNLIADCLCHQWCIHKCDVPFTSLYLIGIMSPFWQHRDILLCHQNQLDERSCSKVLEFPSNLSFTSLQDSVDVPKLSLIVTCSYTIFFQTNSEIGTTCKHPLATWQQIWFMHSWRVL